MKCGLYFITSNWSFLSISSLIASIFLQAKRQLKPGCLVCCLRKFSSTALRACNCLVNDAGYILMDFCDFSSFIKGVSKQRLFLPISLSWTIIRVCSFSWTTCSYYAIRYCSIKESRVISSRTTTFHHSLLCEHTLHFLHLQPPHLPQESRVCQAIFCWINTEPDPHRYTLRTLSESPQQHVKAHLLVSAPISVWSFPS